MKPIIVLLSFFTLFLGFQIQAQVAINASGDQPNSKAMLDVSSETRGMLIPRMTTDQRTIFEATLTATEKGMMVFDTETNAFYFYDGTAFSSISNEVISVMQDADGDTKIEVEKTADQDVIRFSTAGTEYFAMGQGRLGVHNTGGSVFIGQSAGAGDDLSNNNNTGIGYLSMFYNNTGENNTAVGNGSLYSNLSGISNVAIGTNTLHKNTNISELVAIGDSALYWNGDGAIGNYQAHNNTAVGSKALFSNNIGSANTAIGTKTLYSNTSGSGNTAHGYKGLYINTTGSKNTASGAAALNANTTGSGNTAIGYVALQDNTTGQFNMAIGDYSLHKNITGHSNVAVGTHALYSNTSVSSIVAVGDSTLYWNGTGASGAFEAHFNTAIGSKALYNNTTGHNNTANGFESLISSTSGYGNTANGSQALLSNTSGNNNTALGRRSLYENEDGDENTAVGTDALYSNTANANTAVGYLSLYDNTSGTQNAALGSQALILNKLGDDNSVLGFGAMLSNVNGDENTAIGSRALNSSTGDANVAVGYRALYSTTGNNNIAIGYKAGDNITSGSKNIVIGHDINSPSNTGSNRLNIGNLLYGTSVDGTGSTYSTGNIGIGTNLPSEKLTVNGDMQLQNSSGDVNLYLDATSGNPEIQFQHSNTYLGAIGYSFTSEYLYLYEGGSVVLKDGKFGVGTTTPGYTLQVGNSGDGSTARANAWSTFSDRSLKKDLVVMENPTEKLNQLHGYYYYWKDGEDQNRQVGILAQEVEEVLPEIVSTDDEGIKSVDYSKLTPLLIEALKAQQETIQQLESRIEALEN